MHFHITLRVRSDQNAAGAPSRTLRSVSFGGVSTPVSAEIVPVFLGIFADLTPLSQRCAAPQCPGPDLAMTEGMTSNTCRPNPAVIAAVEAKTDLPVLIERSQNGDKRAFDRLLVAVRPRAMAVALKVLRNPDDAEDAVQDAFVKVWRYLGRFEGRSSFTTWLHRIVMNACLDLLRRQSCRPGISDDASADSLDSSPELACTVTPYTQLATCETGAMVRHAIAELSPVHQQAIVLRELEERSYEEIAAAALCPVGTVMSRLHHARKHLADELKQLVESSDAWLCAA